jgi:hypothetical protein
MFKSTKGDSKLGCLVCLLLTAAVIYIGWHWGYAQWNYETMKQKVTEITKLAATTKNVNYDLLKESIYNKADEIGVELYEDSIQISQNQFNFTIEVYWETPIRLPGYTYYLEHSISKTEKKKY